MVSERSQYVDFTKEEFEQRYARARMLMEEAKLDALLITEELNYIYFSGHRACQNHIDKIRPYIYILPRDSEGLIITMPFELDKVYAMTWVNDVRLAGLMSNADFIISVLKDKGLARARIGAELGREQYMGINYNCYMDIKKGLPQAEFLDAAPILLKLRAVKSPREIEYLRKASEIVARAEADVYQAVKIGMTEIDVERMIRIRVAELGGARVTEMGIVSGPGEIHGGMNGNALPRKLQPGELLVLDVGVEYLNYCCDIARSASIGEPTDEVTEFYRWMMSVRQRCVDQMRAGKTIRNVVTACREAIAERGLATMGVGRIGHGVGLQTTEYPSLAMDDGDIILEPGMVFACNPNFVRPFGYVNAEDNWVITEGPAELLSDPIAPNELTVIPI